VVGYAHAALQRYRPAPGLTHLCAVRWILGSLSLGVRQAVCEADHSLPSNTDKNEWSFTSTPLIYFHGMCKCFTVKGLGEPQSQCWTPVKRKISYPILGIKP
jgi:hypothetical protein